MKTPQKTLLIFAIVTTLCALLVAPGILNGFVQDTLPILLSFGEMLQQSAIGATTVTGGSFFRSVVCVIRGPRTVS